MNDVINSIPEDLKQSLAKLLDRKKEPNWKTIVHQTPSNVYDFKKGEFEALRLTSLKPHGSPTHGLIEKLGRKNVQICHFISILEKLPADENIHKALDLFMGGKDLIIYNILLYYKVLLMFPPLIHLYILINLYCNIYIYYIKLNSRDLLQVHILMNHVIDIIAILDLDNLFDNDSMYIYIYIYIPYIYYIYND